MTKLVKSHSWGWSPCIETFCTNSAGNMILTLAKKKNYNLAPLELLNHLKSFLWNSLTSPHLVWGSRSWCQQCCSCRSSTISNQFMISNYICVPNLVIMNELLSVSFDFLFGLYNWKKCCSNLLNQFITSNYPLELNLAVKFY